jgi:threonine dehydratase
MKAETRLPDFTDVQAAARRIKSNIHRTPVVSSASLNQWLGHEILFKCECLQKIGAFKARGGLNTVSWLCESPVRPEKIVANSSGNHAQAVAWAAQMQKIPATIFMPDNVSAVKAQATRAYGAEIVLCESRQQVDLRVEEAAQQAGVVWIPPYNHPQIVAGQGTAAMEALEELDEVDAVFAPCGGGGLLSGTYLAARAMKPQALVIGVEPAMANDAAESRRSGAIQSLRGPADTIADGARTPSVGPITFEFIRQLDDFYEVEEAPIIYWTQWLQHLLKLHIEPTSAMSMDGVVRWLAKQKKRQTVLVILSGGNIDQLTMRNIWAENQLHRQPSLSV